MSGFESTRLDATCVYDPDGSAERLEAAHAKIRADPRFGSHDVWCAATAGDVEALRGHLEHQPDLATTPDPTRGWEPLLWLCYSRGKPKQAGEQQQKCHRGSNSDRPYQSPCLLGCK